MMKMRNEFHREFGMFPEFGQWHENEIENTPLEDIPNLIKNYNSYIIQTLMYGDCCAVRKALLNLLYDKEDENNHSHREKYDEARSVLSWFLVDAKIWSGPVKCIIEE